MSNLNIRPDSSIDLLVAATNELIEESITIFTGMSLPDLSASDLNKLATNIIKSIDKTSVVVDRLNGIPNPDLIKLRLTLQTGIDRLYTTLLDVKTDWATRVLSMETTAKETIDYGSFCYELALKLTTRVSEAVLKNNELPEAEEELDENLEKWI